MVHLLHHGGTEWHPVAEKGSFHLRFFTRQVPAKRSLFTRLVKESHVALIPKNREKLSDPYWREPFN
jgi:hypothetical protein